MITRRDFLKVTGVAAAAAALTACGGSSSTSTASSAASSTAASSEAASAVAKLDKVKVAVPNDTTNEARALTLLEKNGFFKLKADAGLTATKNDIEENPLNVTVDEVEAAQVPNVLQDEDYAVINSNYAISAGLDPMTDALAMEDGTSAYVNVLVCKEATRTSPRSRLWWLLCRASRSRTSWMRTTRALSSLLSRTPPTAMILPLITTR